LPSSSLKGLSSLISFPLYATGFIDTGGKFAAGVVDTGGNLPPVSTTLAKLVAKFVPSVSLIPVVDLYGTCEYLREFSKKFEMVLMGYSGAGGKLIHEKNQKQKIS
jgi:hypothetical protein